ncbi:MAG: prolyl oligopeptidase family serine peptidase [Planctomycetota bacterium]
MNSTQTTLLIAAMWVLLAPSLWCQPQDTQKSGQKTKTESAVPAQAKTPVPTKDYADFENLGFGWALSEDGAWLMVPRKRMDGDDLLLLRDLRKESDNTFKHGTRGAFSADSRWFAFLRGISTKKREKQAKSKKPLRLDLVLVNLQNAKEEEFKAVQRFSFSEDGQHLLIQRYAAKGKKVRDIIVRNLALGHDAVFGNVRRESWSDRGAMLAFAVETGDGLGNGLHLYDPVSQLHRVLDSANKRHYLALSWREKSMDFAALRDTEHDEEKKEKPTHDLLAWPGLHRMPMTPITMKPQELTSFPKDMRVVESGGLTWSDDGERIFFGIRPWEKKPEPKDDEAEEKDSGDSESKKTKEKTEDAKTEAKDETTNGDKASVDSAAKGEAKKEKKTLRESLKDAAGVEVWHAKDVKIMPRQKKTADRDRRRSQTCVFDLADRSFVRLALNEHEATRILEQQRQVLVQSNLRYERQSMFGPTLYDVWLADVATGKRKLLLEGVKYRQGSSPDGRWITFVRNDSIWSCELNTGVLRDLTPDSAGRFINSEGRVLTDENRPYGVADWTRNSAWVLVYDQWDIWAFKPDGSKSLRLTDGATSKTRHRLVRLRDEEDRDFIDSKRPIYVSLFNEGDKKSGYGVFDFGQPLERLAWKDRRLSALRKAKKAGVFAFVEEAFSRPPAILVGDNTLGQTSRAFQLNEIREDYLWGRSELINFKSRRGEPLQGVLTYPAGWEKGKSYPLIVYIYEKRSNQLHRFATPSERRPYNPSVFSAEGYFVFQPDIVYQAQNPGLSAVECVVPAVEKVLTYGLIDKERVGLVGHSWGAYQTSFIVTQTDLFAAGVAGAPLTNMMSMSMNIYWNSGSTNASIFHESQGRMDQPFWRDVETYMKNSPIFNIDALKTPLLIAFGDKDGAVDWHQGIEMYNAARLVDKPLVMLVYEGENHGLAKKKNQVDYHWRVREWFDHHLKGSPAPEWITKGKTFLDREKEIEALEKKKDKKKPKKDA